MYFLHFRPRTSTSLYPLADAVTMHSRMPCCTAATAACMVFVSSMASSLDLQGPVLNLHFLCCSRTRAKPAYQMVLSGVTAEAWQPGAHIFESMALSKLCKHTCQLWPCMTQPSHVWGIFGITSLTPTLSCLQRADACTLMPPQSA